MIPRCACGRKAMTVAPGSEASYAPGHVLVNRAMRDKAWCARCATARGWLATPAAPIPPAACPSPRSARKSALAKPRRKS